MGEAKSRNVSRETASTKRGDIKRTYNGLDALNNLLLLLERCLELLVHVVECKSFGDENLHRGLQDCLLWTRSYILLIVGVELGKFSLDLFLPLAHDVSESILGWSVVCNIDHLCEDLSDAILKCSSVGWVGMNTGHHILLHQDGLQIHGNLLALFVLVSTAQSMLSKWKGVSHSM